MISRAFKVVDPSPSDFYLKIGSSYVGSKTSGAPKLQPQASRLRPPGGELNLPACKIRKKKSPSLF